jgi:hypothetical protein
VGWAGVLVVDEFEVVDDVVDGVRDEEDRVDEVE